VIARIHKKEIQPINDQNKKKGNGIGPTAIMPVKSTNISKQ
jgi:hypothetical protein